MKHKILIMLALASLCGGGAIFIARGVLEDRDEARLAAMAVEKPAVAFRTIVVASQPLRFGTVLAPEMLTTLPWPGDALPAGAFETVDALLGAEKRSVLFPLEANEPLLASKVTGPGERAALSRVISEGSRAVTLRVNDVAGVAGFVLPGDRVDVLLTAQSGETTTSDVILQGVRVLSIDQLADERADAPMVVKSVTVEVDLESAQKITLAQTIGSLSLTLRRAGEEEPVTAETVTVADFVGAAPQPMPALATLAATPVETVDTQATVGVTRMMERQEYRVPSRQPSPRPAGPAIDLMATAATSKVTVR